MHGVHHDDEGFCFWYETKMKLVMRAGAIGLL